MSCGCNKNNSREVPAPNIKNNIVGNTLKAIKKQPDKLKFFKEGAKGLFKCISEPSDLTDQQVQERRDICRECDKSSKKDGKLTTASQCTECGCSILCKSQFSENTCPLSKWPKITPLTISNTPV